MIGPFRIELKIHLCNDTTKQTATVDFTLAPGRLPTVERLHSAIGECLAKLPDGWRLLGANEFFNRVLIKEQTGRVGNFALPKDFDYDVDELTTVARAAYVPKPEPRRARRSSGGEEE